VQHTANDAAFELEFVRQYCVCLFCCVDKLIIFIPIFSVIWW